jgi:hypothetical protein
MSKPTHTWNTYKAYIDSITLSGQSLLYRGQSNSSWGLVSTYHRLAEPGDPAIYWQVLSLVHDYVSTWVGKTWNLANDVELAAFVGFLQHNGFPTPLLDWTRSPYAAAYFAYEGVNDLFPQSDHVAVFCFDSVRWTREWQQVYDVRDPSSHVSVLLSESRGNHKQILQQGVYTFASVRDQERHIRAAEASKKQTDNGHPGYLMKVTLPVEEKPLAMRDLALMGISAMTLFPSVEGLCKHLRQSLFPAARIGLTPTQRTNALLESLARLQVEKQLTDPEAPSLPSSAPQTGAADATSTDST